MKKPELVEITISNRTVLRVIALALLTVVALNFVSSVGYILRLILIAAFLAIVLNPIVGWVARNLKVKSRIGATAFAYLAVVIIIGTFLASVMPPLVRQTVSFVRDAPHTIEELKTGDTAVSRFVQRNNLEAQIDGFSDNIRDVTGGLQKPAVSTAGRVGGALISIITVLVLTFMLLAEGPSWLRKYWSLLTPAKRAHHQKLAGGMYRMVTGFAIGQLLLAVIGASFAFIVLVITSTLLNVSVNALALAGVLVFTGLIPMIGNTLGGVTVVLSCVFVSLPLAVIMATFFIVYQQIENITLQPHIQAKYNELTPLLVFVAALLGIGAAGFIGALVAIPVAGCIKILVQDYFDRNHNHLKKA